MLQWRGVIGVGRLTCCDFVVNGRARPADEEAALVVEAAVRWCWWFWWCCWEEIGGEMGGRGKEGEQRGTSIYTISPLPPSTFNIHPQLP